MVERPDEPVDVNRRPHPLSIYINIDIALLSQSERSWGSASADHSFGIITR